MGKRFLRSSVIELNTLTPTVDIAPQDLPVNPLSFVVLTLELTQTASQAALNTYRELSPFLAAVTDLSIRHRGENILQGSLQDIAVMNLLLGGARPWGREHHGVAASARTMSFVIGFSRKPYWHSEAFPATQRGNLRFHMSAGALPAGYTAMRWALESCELIEDTPSTYLKYTTNTRALAATGRQRMPLPIGNEILGILLFDPSDEVDATMSYAFRQVKILRDNVEQYVAQSSWHALAADLGLREGTWPLAWGHRHEQAAADTNTGDAVQLTADIPPLQYGYLDFDPLKDGTFSMETAGASQLDLDLNSDVSAGTVRILPVELVKIPGAAGAAA
jgi:hypothetical protein